MKYLFLISFIFLLACNKEEGPTTFTSTIETHFPTAGVLACNLLNPFILSGESEETSIILFFIAEQINLDNVCIPDSLHIYLSKDNVGYEKIASIDPLESPYHIENLESGKEYYIKAVHIHTELAPFESNLIRITTGSVSLPCTEENCDILNPFSFAGRGEESSIVVYFSQTSIVDAFAKVCLPDAIEFYLSEDNAEFQKVVRLNPDESPYVLDGLENDKAYFIKMVNLHCELNPIEFGPISITAGEVKLPSFINNPQSTNLPFEDFRLAKDQNHFVGRNTSDDWKLTAFDNLTNQSLVALDAFYAEWNPQVENEVAFVLQQLIANAWKTKSLVSLNTSTNELNTLHEIDDPDAYWIHEFRYSLDGKTIYFKSNKDNGGSTSFEYAVYENLFALDIETKEIKMLSNFLPEDFDLTDFIEDPLRPGNFYILGGLYNENSPTQGGIFFTEKRIDVYYYDSVLNSRTPTLITDYKEQNISIDGRGENLVFSSDQSGVSELWSYNLSTQAMKQLTDRTITQPSYRWHHVNWISDTEFMVYVEHDGVRRFAVYEL